MNRARFGLWGADLGDADFARAVAALGVIGASFYGETGATDPRDVPWQRFEDFMMGAIGRASDGSPLGVSLPFIATFASEELPGGTLRDLWTRLKSKLGDPRLEVIGQLLPDTMALAALLSSPAVGAGSVYIRQDEPEVGVVWNWPLRVGLLPGFRTDEAREIVNIPWPELIDVVELGEGETECDLLVLPGSLPSALAAILELERHPRADCVLVLGSPGASGHRALPLMQSIRAWCETAGVSVASIPRGLRNEWFVHFVAELAHDNPLDVAVRLATKSEMRTSPLLIASRRLIDASRISEHVTRVAEDLAAAAFETRRPEWSGSRTEEAPDVPAPAPADDAIEFQFEDRGAFDLDLEALPPLADKFEFDELSPSPSADETELPGSSSVTSAGYIPRPRRSKIPPADKIKLDWPSPMPADGYIKINQPSRMPADGYIEIDQPSPMPTDGVIDLDRPSPGPTADDFNSALQTTDFKSELHGATTIARMKRAMPPSMRVLHRAAKMDGGARDERRLLSQTFDAKDRKIPLDALTPGGSYLAAFWIGENRDGVVPADAPFPSHLLPPDPRGHRLTVVFAPLASEKEEVVEQPQTAEIFLAPAGDSDRCTFSFRATSSGGFVARVIVLFQNRVLQTLRYGQPPGEKTISLASEVDSYRLDDLEGRRRFDAALVFNESPGGSTGLFTIIDGTAKFSAPVGLEKTIGQISELLGQLTASVTLPDSLDDADLSRLLFTLANHGHTMWVSLGLAEKAQELAAAKRIHVVATRPGEFVPVELFYPRDAPRTIAVCGHARQMINTGASSRCSSTDPRLEICPLEFWGFSRVIERFPASQPGTANTSAPPRIDLFRNALIGASKQVSSANVTAITERLGALTDGRCTLATSWGDWETLVLLNSPSLLVLLPHSLESAIVPGLPALEIGGVELPVSWLSETHLRMPGSTELPVVLLLGCSTQLSEAAYQNFAEAFKRLGASVVLSTLSLILGRHATSFAQALLEELKARSGSNATFGDVLLEVKRKRIARGDPFVISLVSYGDSEIRV